MKMEINKTEWVISAAIIIIFRMAGLYYAVPQLKYVYAFLEFIVMVLAIWHVIVNKQFNNIIFFIITIYFIYNFLNTLLKSGDILQITSTVISDYTVFLIALSMSIEGKIEELIYSADRIFKFFLFLNLIHMIFTTAGFGYTRSMNKIYILASDNALGFYLIIFVVVHELRNRFLRYSVWKNVLFYAVCLYEVYVGEAATSYFVIFVLLISVVVANQVKINKFSFAILSVYLLANYLMLYVRNFDYIKSIVTKMGKNLTFSGRTEIWDRGIKIAEKSLITGKGVTENTYYILYHNYLMEAHNMLLSQVLQGGLILLVIFLIMLLFFANAVRKRNDYVATLTMVGVLAYFVSFLVESPAVAPGFFMLLGIGGIKINEV